MNSKKRRLRVASIISTLDLKAGGPAKTILDQNIFFNKVKKYQADIVSLEYKHALPKYFLSFKIKKIINFSRHSFFYKFKFLGINRYPIQLNFLNWLIKNKNNYDVFILHGIWDFKNLVARLFIKKKYYIFLHGSLDPYERKNFFKYIKKKIYWFLVEKRNLKHAKAVLFTTAGEKRINKNTFVNTDGLNKLTIDYAIVLEKYNNSVCSNKFFKVYPFLKNKKYYLFLGRIDPKKGCDILLRSIHLLGNKFKSNLVFAGDYNNSTGEELKKLVTKLDLQEKVFFLGHLINEIKGGVLINSKAMLLCSHDENFGISLVESLGYGKPVLTTYKVNIFKKILAYKAGYIANDNAKSFCRIINKFENLNLRQKRLMSKNARNCFKENFNLLNKKDFIPDFEKK
jgi:glycosyltransferase involved in cell wall biosynthesis